MSLQTCDPPPEKRKNCGSCMDRFTAPHLTPCRFCHDKKTDTYTKWRPQAQ